MSRNSDLRDWVRLYGAPDYAEVQELEIDPPFAPYEVRLYYLKGNSYLAFGRVHVAPTLYDYGVRKYIGHIDPAELDRLLTAEPAVDNRDRATDGAGDLAAVDRRDDRGRGPAGFSVAAGRGRLARVWT